MKEFTLLSGKGGTGKTSLTAALAALACDAVLCDNDVDAADLHLILQPQIKQTTLFEGARVASIDPEHCTGCGICADLCRYDAIHKSGDNTYTIDGFSCEGCRLCERVCPAGAIASERSTNNHWFVSETRFGTLIHAQMGPGEENSGKLVALIRENARKVAQKQGTRYIINDGPPGIGCAAISSVTGTNHVLIVIEPTLSGLHDAIRLVKLVRDFHIDMSAVINKFDLNEDITREVEEFLDKNHIPLLARIPYDTAFTEAMIEGKTLVEYAHNSDTYHIIKSLWEQLKKRIKQNLPDN
ncbi:MAG TPA: 4Fe-4S binding protein [Prolixibacteraceae bacterium]|nr:4Fe-4S binding protein [Prolixibacteraceae bacterium]